MKSFSQMLIWMEMCVLLPTKYLGIIHANVYATITKWPNLELHLSIQDWQLFFHVVPVFFVLGQKQA